MQIQTQSFVLCKKKANGSTQLRANAVAANITNMDSTGLSKNYLDTMTSKTSADGTNFLS